MRELAENGIYTINDAVMDKIQQNFVGLCSLEDQTRETLKHFYDDYGYLADTHTSVALNCAEQYQRNTSDNKKIIVASTASPYKFAADVFEAIENRAASDGTAALDELSALTNTQITYPLRDLDKRQVNFRTVIDADDMLREVFEFT